MKRINIILAILIVLLVSATCYLMFFRPTYNIASVNYRKAFEDFQLKKDLEKRLENTRFQRQKLTDSLGVELNKLVNQSATTNNENLHKLIEARKEEYLTKRDQFKQDNQIEASNYDKQIFTQMKQYAKDYSLANGYDWVLSDDGEFAIVYAAETHDVTKDFLEYINLRYKGVK